MPSSAWRSTLFPYTTLFRSDRKSTRLNSSHDQISYAVFCLKKKKKPYITHIDYVADTHLHLTPPYQVDYAMIPMQTFSTTANHGMHTSICTRPLHRQR